MTPFRRRKPLNPQIGGIRDSFRRVTSELDAAQRMLLAAVPTSRDPGRPLKPALDGFIAGLARAEGAMPGWRSGRTESLWRRCADALVESHAQARRLRDDPSAEAMDFEALNARLGDLVAPLEEFADVAPELKRLR